MHFSTFKIPDIGEGTIDELVLFSESGKLADVERKWTAVKKYALLVDQSHSTAVAGVRAALSEHTKTPPSNEDELDDVILASMELDALSESDSVLVKSLIFLLLASFHEYGLKKIHKLVQPENPPPAKHAFQRICTNLKNHGLLENVPDEYETDFNRFRDPVRNNLAHGDWSALAQELHALDLTKAFLAVAGFFLAFSPKLVKMGHDV
jgi:hypothetical protein